jgi:ABC-type methionine transport system permease subunit
MLLEELSRRIGTIVAIQQLCICAFPFKARFLFTMRNTVIAMVTTFFICVMMVLPYLMISNVTAEKRLFSNNDAMLIVDVDSVLSQDFILAYINEMHIYTVAV